MLLKHQLEPDPWKMQLISSAQTVSQELCLSLLDDKIEVINRFNTQDDIKMSFTKSDPQLEMEKGEQRQLELRSRAPKSIQKFCQLISDDKIVVIHRFNTQNDIKMSFTKSDPQLEAEFGK